MARLAPVAYVLSLILLLFGLTMALPLGMAVLLQDVASLIIYLKAVAATLGCAALLWALTRRFKRELQVRDGFLLVTLVWAVLPAFAAIPLRLYLPDLSLTDVYFEGVSAITTTGSTVLSGLDHLPPSINFWRGELQWLGGMGIIVLAVAILPLLGVGGMQLFKAETPGPMKEAKLTPRITQTAKGLWLIYAALTLLCIFSLGAARMSWFDAVIHGFATMSLGGFSTHDASYAYFDSPLIEAITIGFMLIAAINFGTHFSVWREKSSRPYRSDPEAKAFLLLMLASTAGIAFFLVHAGTYPDYWVALRFTAFNLVSVATTTGFASTDYNLWPAFAPAWMLFLSTFCCCAGSTGGGIKMLRAIILCKQVSQELLRTMHPHAVSPIKLGRQPVANQVVFAVLAFIFVYGSSIICFSLLLTASGLDIVTAFSAIVACTTNTGPGLNAVGPATTFAMLSDLQTWICAAAMLLGRLELFTVLIVLSPRFWRK